MRRGNIGLGTGGAAWEGLGSGHSWVRVCRSRGRSRRQLQTAGQLTLGVLLAWLQVARCEHLLPPLRQSARTAARAMDRTPISDLVT